MLCSVSDTTASPPAKSKISEFFLQTRPEEEREWEPKPLLLPCVHSEGNKGLTANGEGVRGWAPVFTISPPSCLQGQLRLKG